MASLWVGTSRSSLSITRIAPRICRAQRRGLATPPPADKKAKPPPVSSCPEGTILAGIQYLKDAPPLVAKADEAYPAWLWTLLDDTPPAGKKGAKQARNATAREEQERLARERERERRIATETQEEKWERERAELDEERRKMRRENREKIRYQNFMKTT